MKGFTAALLLALSAQALPAQQAGTAVIPDSVTVGDVFRAAIRVTVPAGARVVFPDTLAVPEDVEAAARREVQVDTGVVGMITHTAVYALTAWRPGRMALPPVTLTVELPDGGRRVQAAFPALVVHSVLPVDTAGIQPQPPKDVIGPSRLMWPIVLGLAALTALLFLGIWLYGRRKPREVLTTGLAPRDTALAELDRIRALGLLEKGDVKAFYTAVAEVLRSYVTALEGAWSPDLTTSELERAMAWTLRGARRGSATQVKQVDQRVAAFPLLIELLDEADLVKFAGRRPVTRTALAAWERAREWTLVFDWPPPADTEREAQQEEAA
jgi:hypothetical protein